MQRTLSISVDEDSWTTFGRVVPNELRPLGQTHAFNIFATMLRLGALTTPVRTRGLSLNSFWAYIRYFGAFSQGGSLKLHSDFYNLDPHQKTILSDDFGVAFSMEFLRSKLNLRRVCDGQYFMQRFAQKRGLSYVQDPTVHGPQKCPDYICLGGDGMIHLVECKGTQSGRSALRKQMARGIEQKNSINVQGPRAGEKLVTGLLIKKDSARTNSEMVICDPIDISPAFIISEDDYGEVEADIVVGEVARYVAAAGFEDTSFFLASRLEGDRLMKNGGSKFTRKSYIEKPYHEEELVTGESNEFVVGGKSYLGREQVIDLPSSFTVEGKRKTRAVVKAGINRELFLSLRDQRGRRSSGGWPLFEVEKDFWRVGSSLEKENESYGEIVDSGIYASTLVLE